MSVSIAFALSLLLPSLDSPKIEPERPRPGSLVVVGGGGTPRTVLVRSLELAGGVDRPVLVIPFASSREDAGSRGVEMWRAAGATQARALDRDASVAECRSSIERAELIWFSGGSQNRLMDALRERSLVAEIRERHRAGVVVGGTSAGAAVMSARMITGEAELEAVRIGTTELTDGLGLWPGVIVDQHFLARRRFARLLAATLEHPSDIGVGIDERTAVIVDGRKLTVAGESSVLLIDARAATIERRDPERRSRAEGVELHLLSTGDHWRWGEPRRARF